MILNGVSIWEHAGNWRRRGDELATIEDPLYPPRRHTFPVYEIDDGRSTIVFAIGEVSNGIYLLAVPADAGYKIGGPRRQDP